MLKKIILLLILPVFISSCTSFSFYKDKLDMKGILDSKTRIDNAENPARKLLLKNELSEKIVILKNIKVKDITTSTNVDYDFCVVSEMKTENGDVEIYIYSKNIRKISQLKRGESVIDIEGEFSRFFSTLDNYYVKIEVIKSKIDIKK